VNDTIEKFGYPATLIAEHEHWVVLLRPAQPTAGSLVLAAKSGATSYGELPAQAFAEQAEVIAGLEAMLRRAVNYDKINYLMLMMVDPHVHFHVIPRYADSRSLAGISIADPGWPGPPDLKSATSLDPASIEAAVRVLKPLHPQGFVQDG
jgi:diadenosine tetraphosphate (Ap4A) HIT family hydrolase